MNDEERARLLELSADLSARSDWQPACVAAAFRTRKRGEVSFTMQRWIDLDAICSPLLRGELPDTAEELQESCVVFGMNLDELEPREAVDVGEAIRSAIEEGFGMALPMKPPEHALDDGADDGFGEFLPILAKLVTECGMSRAEALQTEVGQAFAIIAADQRNRGWTVAGRAYARRDQTRNAEPGTRDEEEAR